MPKKPPHSKTVTLAGVTKLFENATRSKDSADLVKDDDSVKDSADLVELLEASAHHQDDSIVIRASKAVPDTFKVSGEDEDAVKRFVKGLSAFWASHTKGAALSKSTEAVLGAKAYTSKMFVNFEEPVVDVWAVVVLYNPVHSNLDQRESKTVQRFWNRFRDAGGDVGKWMSHVVFLDLVPLLHSGKQGNLAPAEKAENKDVAKAAKLKIFTKYAITRIRHYVDEAGEKKKSFPVILCSGQSAKKLDAVNDFKDTFKATFYSKEKPAEAELFDCKYHPMANECKEITPVLRKFLTSQKS